MNIEMGQIVRIWNKPLEMFVIEEMETDACVSSSTVVSK